MYVQIFFPSIERGGVENVLVSLLNSSSSQVKYEVLTVRCNPEVEARFPSNVNVIRLDQDRRRGRTVSTIISIPPLARHLMRNDADALLVFQGALAAVVAKAISRKSIPLIMRESNTPSAALAKSVLTRHAKLMLKQVVYKSSTAIVALSEYARNDILALGADPQKVNLIHNPLGLAQVVQQAQEEVNHDWLREESGLEVVIGVGRFAHQKDFATLIKAFAMVRSKRKSVRLLLIGDGSERPVLKQLATDLDVNESVDMLGFKLNPHKFMSRSSVFVLPSRYEGLPNVLIEAQACRVPCIATDAPGGSAEVLMNGKAGIIVPVSDFQAIAKAILDCLEHPEAAMERIEVAFRGLSRFDSEASAQQYIDLIAKLAYAQHSIRSK